MASGEQIKRARDARGLSQADLARAVGVEPPTIGKIESGRTRRSRVMPEIEQYLGLMGDGHHASLDDQEIAALHLIAANLRMLTLQVEAMLQKAVKRRSSKGK